jgi:hypothetical protein
MDAKSRIGPFGTAALSNLAIGSLAMGSLAIGSLFWRDYGVSRRDRHGGKSRPLMLPVLQRSTLDMLI